MDLLLCFVDRQEVRRLSLPTGTRTPYGALERVLASLGYGPWRAVWADDFNNFTSIQSDAVMHQALASRRHPSQAIRILIKEIGPMRGPADSRGAQLRWRQDGNLMIAQRFHNENNFGERSQPFASKFSPNEAARRVPEGGERRLAPHPQPTPLSQSRRDFQHGRVNQAVQSPTVLPKDPTLSELVDKVRLNLEGALKSMENSMCSSRLFERSNQADSNEAEEHVKEVDEEKENDDDDGEDSEMCKTVCGSLEKDEGAMENARAELLSALRDLPLRPESALSEEFTIITPSTDHNSLMVFDKDELEAALCELNSEIDAFEIVAEPEDWDSDGDWNCV